MPPIISPPIANTSRMIPITDCHSLLVVAAAEPEYHADYRRGYVQAQLGHTYFIYSPDTATT